MPDKKKAKTSQDADPLAGLPFIDSTLEFGGVTHINASDDPAKSTATPVRLYDARPEVQRFTLDEHSFQLVRTEELHPTYSAAEPAFDIYDPQACARHYYPMVERLLLARVPGATRVLPFDHLLRNRKRMEALGKGNGLSAPLTAVHGDYTHRSGRTRAQNLLSPHESEVAVQAALGQRFAIMNVWHPFKPVQSDPLAMAVWGSYRPRDVRTQRLTFPHRVGETLA
jgi:hypothetical protein